MTNLPHFDWPIRLHASADGTIGFALVEQDTPAELAASAAVIASTPRGHRDDDPTFGVTSPVFEQGALDTVTFAAELNEADPRLEVEAEDVIDLTNATVRKLTVAVDGAA